MSRIQKVLLFAEEKHKGQFDKGGYPYILHPIFVALQCKTESTKVVALLHDILEDTDTTIDELKELGLTEKEISAIQLLTKNDKKEDYLHYIKRVSKDPIAREVKKWDLHHNMDTSRLSEITERDLKRIAMYEKALSILLEREREDNHISEDDLLL